MPASKFDHKAYIKTSPTRLLVEKRYDFSGGLDTYSSNEIMEPKYSPYLRNLRNTSRDTIKTRQGAGFYSVPIGETLSTQQTSVTGASTQAVGIINYFAAKVVIGATGRLSKVELNLKTTTPAGTGPIIVEWRSDSSGSPGAIVATSSIASNALTSTAAYVAARFIEAPQVTNGTTYWVTAHIQDDGTNTYLWTSTTNATTAKTSIDAGVTWSTSSFDLNYKTYVSTDSPVLGLTRFYRSSPSKTTVMAHGTSHYTINDSTGVTTAFKTSLSASATDYYYAYAQDIMYYVNGFDAPRQYDLTTDQAVAGSPGISSLMALHKNRLFFVSATDPTKLVFSDEGAYTTYQSTSFLYVPAPKSTDPITAVVSFQDNLVIFTRKKKWILYGNTLSNFILREAAGKQGATTQNAVVPYMNYIYFCNDVGVFSFNGSSDQQLSERVTPTYALIADKTKLHAVVWQELLYVFNAVPGSAVNNQALIYDTRYQSFLYDTNQYLTRSALLNGQGDTSNQMLLASSIIGAVYMAETQGSDLGKAIEFQYWTKYDSFGDPSRQKRAKRFYPQFKVASTDFNLLISYDKDYANAPVTISQGMGGTGAVWGSGIIWGSFTWGSPGLVTPRLTVAGKFKYLQLRFARTGVENSFETLGYENYWIASRAR